MEIIPAIDLLDGEVVRLYKGAYGNKTTYKLSPVSILNDFKNNDINRVHIVDLNGAKNDLEGSKKNYSIIKTLTKEFDFTFELGGGIRTEKKIFDAFNNGISKVILGTILVRDFSFFERMVENYKEKIIAGLDLVKENNSFVIKVEGWEEKANLKTNELLSKIDACKCKEVIVTDINTDGTLKGPNLELMESLNSSYSFNLISSGGVSSVEDLISLKKLDIHGAIVGKAYYDGKISLMGLTKLLH